LAQEDGYTLEDLDEDQELKKHYAMLAERDLRMNGYHIHSTIDKDIYDTMHEKALNFEHYGPKQKNPNGDEEPVQGAGILIENNIKMKLMKTIAQQMLIVKMEVR